MSGWGSKNCRRPAASGVGPSSVTVTVASPPPAAITLHEGPGRKPLVELALNKPPDAPTVIPIDANGWSFGNPDDVYEALKDGIDKEQVHFTRLMVRGSAKSHKRAAQISDKNAKGKPADLIQADKWLREHYDPWPMNYGIGADSLLPWFAKGSASKSGVVHYAAESGLDAIEYVKKLLSF